MCTAVRKRIYAILGAMNTTERVVEIRLGKKIQARTGLKYENCLILVSNMVWTNTWSKNFETHPCMTPRKHLITELSGKLNDGIVQS